MIGVEVERRDTHILTSSADIDRIAPISGPMIVRLLSRTPYLPRPLCVEGDDERGTAIKRSPLIMTPRRVRRALQ